MKDCNNKSAWNQQASVAEEQSDTNMFFVSHAVTEVLSDDVWLVDSACNNHIYDSKSKAARSY